MKISRNILKENIFGNVFFVYKPVNLLKTSCVKDFLLGPIRNFETVFFWECLQKRLEYSQTYLFNGNLRGKKQWLLDELQNCWKCSVEILLTVNSFFKNTIGFKSNANACAKWDFKDELSWVQSMKYCGSIGD